MVLSLSGCVTPTGEQNISREYKSFKAYGELWTFSLNAVKRNYFTLDSDSFSYPVYEKFIKSESGKKINIANSIFVIQKDGTFAKYSPEYNGVNGMNVWELDGRIFLSIGRVPLIEMTDCYGFRENNTGLRSSKSIVEVFGELDLETKSFYLSKFIPFSSSIYNKMRDAGLHPKVARKKAYYYSANLNCSEPFDLEITQKESEDILVRVSEEVKNQ